MASRFTKRFILAIASPVVLIAATECALRLADYGYPTTFLVADTINGREVWRDNPYFGYRFFPTRMTRMPQPIVLDRKKPDDTVRIFMLGESAMMGEPQALFGPARFLESVLRTRLPDGKFEVVNAAMTAINSHVIAEIARDIAKAEPDFVVLYIGNNEVVGPFGPGTVIGTSGGLSRLRVLASRLRLAQLLRPREQGMRWAGMEMFTERRVAADDRRLDPVYAAYRANLGRIVDAARGAGASVLLCTVAVNLRDCPPFAGEAAGEAFAAGRLDEARDLDELRFRADSRMSGIVKEVASARPGDVRLIDIERTFNRAGDDLFVDHVHFTPAGSYKLGMSIAEIAMHDLGARMEDSGRIPSLDDCLDRMLYTPWNELDVTDAMLVRYGRPPFSSQPGHAAHRGSLASRRLVLREEIAARDLAQERSRFEAAMAATPEDWRLPAQWGEILLNAGLYDEAEEHLRRVLEALPHRIEMLGGLAMVLGYAGRADEGAQLFAQLPAKAHALAVEHLLQLSRSMMEDRRVAEAEAFASVALKLEPEDADVQFELAREHLALGRMEEAEKELQRLVDRWPDHTPARNELSAVLAKGKRWAEADAVLLRGVQDVDTQLKRVQLKMGAGDMDAAGEQLRALESSGAEPGPVYMTRGIWHMIRREPDLAIAAYTKSLEARPDARTYFDLARAQVQAGRAADARASLKAALELDPGNSACVALLKELGMP